MTTNPHQFVLAKVIAGLEKMTQLSDQAKLAFSHSVSLRDYDKGEFLLEHGQRDSGLFLIVKGLVRFVYLSPEGKEYNKSFAAEGEFVGCLLSMLSAQSCRFSIQALEQCQCLYLSNAKRKQLYQQYPQWERVGRILVEQLALKKEAREAEFLLDSAETRYQRFISQHPQWAERLPQYHIASYLGITDVALSRIRHRNSST